MKKRLIARKVEVEKLHACYYGCKSLTAFYFRCDFTEPHIASAMYAPSSGI